jgi:hypothetical protein
MDYKFFVLLISFFIGVINISVQPLNFPSAGPGCSSVGYGAASELGPLLINGNGTGLEFNKFAWNKGMSVSFFIY